MKSIKFKLDIKSIERIVLNLKEFEKSKPNVPGISYFFKYKKSTITIYNNGTVWIQGAEPEETKNEINNILDPKNISEKNNKKQNVKKEINKKEKKEMVMPTIDFSVDDSIKMLKTDLDFDSDGYYGNQMGADEVGVGDYFGPIVTCSAYVESKNMENLWRLGVRDSKKMTDEKMEKIYDSIIEVCEYEVAILRPKEYNQMIEYKFNAHHIKTYLHNSSINKLLNKIDSKDKPRIVMDQYCTEKQYEKYSKDLKQTKAPISLFETKAESKYISVAVASIIARVTFIRIMKDMAKKLGVNRIPLGASKEVEAFARELVSKIGKDKLRNLVKYDFNTTKKVLDV